MQKFVEEVVGNGVSSQQILYLVEKAGPSARCASSQGVTYAAWIAYEGPGVASANGSQGGEVVRNYVEEAEVVLVLSQPRSFGR